MSPLTYDLEALRNLRMTAKYVLGIDLGTTNCVLAYAPLEGELAETQLFAIPQLVDAGTLDKRTMLPAFAYLAPPHAQHDQSLDVPWTTGRDFAVGELARRQAADAPDRTVGAAKSWLGYSRVDRRAAILPWNAPDDFAKISPVTASQRYLEHVVAAWESEHPEAPVGAHAWY